MTKFESKKLMLDVYLTEEMRYLREVSEALQLDPDLSVEAGKIADAIGIMRLVSEKIDEMVLPLMNLARLSEELERRCPGIMEVAAMLIEENKVGHYVN